MRTLFPEQRYLELFIVWTETPLALFSLQKRQNLRELHEQLRADRVKVYWALVAGKWPAYQKSVSAPSQRHTPSGERIVKVSADGKSQTDFKVLERLPSASLRGKAHFGPDASNSSPQPARRAPDTGRHEYNDASEDITSSLGLKRLFLHAKAIRFRVAGRHYELECPLSTELEAVLEVLRVEGH